jgi:hypothetical protein
MLQYILTWLEDNLLGLVALIGAIVAPTVTLVQARLSTKVQLQQIRPEIVTHGCRVSGLPVYTYVDENNKMSEPACVYLASDGSRKCKFEPPAEEARRMLEINCSQCYLSLWGDKTSR